MGDKMTLKGFVSDLSIGSTVPVPYNSRVVIRAKARGQDFKVFLLPPILCYKPNDLKERYKVFGEKIQFLISFWLFANRLTINFPTTIILNPD